MASTRLIAVDWGTTRLRAYLLDAQGMILDRISQSDGGMQSVPEGAFAATLQGALAPWLNQNPDLAVIMAGMVGARNGWVEAPYVRTPASAAELAAQMMPVKREDGRQAWIVPGVAHVAGQSADVMRGEETLIFGCGRPDARVVLPGTHSKWAEVREGRITRFSTYMTGEIYAWARQNSILSRLAQEPEDEAGFERGLAAAKESSGLTHELFCARSNVLCGLMSGQEVGPYLSGLLIGTEIQGALQTFERSGDIIVVADGHMAQIYQQSLHFYGLTARLIAPEQALVAGLAVLQSYR
jgi:2-dehydro-3-deoxygalactonokinase